VRRVPSPKLFESDAFEAYNSSNGVQRDGTPLAFSASEALDYAHLTSHASRQEPRRAL
jgi:hypothetical protein